MIKSSIVLRSMVAASLLFGTVEIVSATDIVKPKEFVKDTKAKKYAEKEVIVKFKDNADVFTNNTSEKRGKHSFHFMGNATEKFSNKFQTKMSRKFKSGRFKTKSYKKLSMMHLKSDDNSTEELLNYFKSADMKEYVESVSVNNIMEITSSNDSHYDKLWAIENTGQSVNGTSGTSDADMDVSEAWEKTTGDKDVIVAVLDTGVDYRHGDLKDNMWNGTLNHGYDFAGDEDGNNDDDPMPDTPYDENGHYHGTHVAGTIGAVGNNNNGVAGVAQNVSIMALKVFRPNGYGYTSDILEALDYVSERVDAGDNIVAINASYGGGGGSQDDSVNSAIKKLGTQGVMFCAAAGNSSKDIDAEPSYPAAYDADNIISVAASDQNDELASFSNYGENNVDVAAPGTNILSTYPDDQYAYLQGTSMATPNVAGVVALVASYYPNSTVAERKAMILDNVDVKSAFAGKMVTGGRVNVNAAMSEEAQSNNAPVAENDSTTTAYETAVTVAVLSNDSDEDNDSLALKSYTQATNGSVAKDGETLIYTPNNSFSGEDTFTYTITDGEDEATATVTVTVDEKPNSAPIGKDDTSTTAYETAVTIDVLANDSDEDEDTLSIKSTSEASNGSVKIENGKVVYTPNEGFSGDDKFTYTLSDGEAETEATVVVTVDEKPNTAPIAKDDTSTTAYETAVVISVLENDSDEDSDSLTLTSYTEAKNGSIEKDGSNLIYTPNTGFSGEDSFSYTMTDGKEDATATVTITVEEKPNTAPIAKDDTSTTEYETAVTIDVLANDSDEDKDTLTIKSVSEANNGSVKIENGKVVYTPYAGFSGDDKFTYTLSDGEEETEATVVVTVGEKANTAPIAQDDISKTAYETAVTIDVLSNDSDEDKDVLSIKSLGQAKNGSVVIEDGKVVYTPNKSFSGDDTFTYVITDGEVEAEATVVVTVKEEVEAPNEAPKAEDDKAETAYETAVVIDVLVNDSDADEDTLSIKSVGQAENGATVIENGKVTYKPNEGFSGEDKFTYTITDGEDEVSATVIVTVGENPNHAPEAKDDKAETAYETAVTIDVLENDSDVDEDKLSIKSVGNGEHGSVAIDNGKVTYKPNEGFSGDDKFTYTITDGEVETKATVSVHVNEKPNNAPKAEDDSAETAYETAVTIDVLANDSDADADKLSIKSVGHAENGKVVIENGTVVYTPNNEFSGKDTFTYKVSDGKTEREATVVVVVNEKQNHAPEANNNEAKTAYETAVTIDVLANDRDADDDKLKITSTTRPSNGTADIKDGKIVYTPNNDFSGDDKFTYTISDGKDESTATVVVTVKDEVEVEDPNHAPKAKDDKIKTSYEKAVTIKVLKNDRDEDKDKLSIIAFTKASNGTIKQDGDNLIYTPNDKFSGDDKFSYTITDGKEKSTATVKVTVKKKRREVRLPGFGAVTETPKDKWKELDFSFDDIGFNTKSGTDVTMGKDADHTLVGSFSKGDKESKVNSDIADTIVIINAEGATEIKFGDTDMKLEISVDGEIKPFIPNALLPKEKLPLGTKVEAIDSHVKFSFPMSKNIQF